VVDVPLLEITDYREIRDEDIANECRARWGLGSGPISDVLLVLENAGITVVKEEVGSAANVAEMDNYPYSCRRLRAV
jgi:hypothetical protein